MKGKTGGGRQEAGISLQHSGFSTWGRLVHALYTKAAVLVLTLSFTPAELKKGLFATEVGTMRAPETVAAVFERIQTLIGAMRRCEWVCAYRGAWNGGW